eukprot:6352029-Amphidinium_carterae.1
MVTHVNMGDKEFEQSCPDFRLQSCITLAMPWTGVSMYKLQRNGQRALLTCSTFGTSCSLVDTGATNFLLDMSMIPSEVVGVKNTSVTLAIGQQQASVWRAEIFADGVKTTLMPIGRCCELLDLTFERANRSARLWCRKNSEERAHRRHSYLLMEFYIHNTLAYASPSQTEMVRKAQWTRAAHADLKFDSGWFEKVQHGHDCVCASLSELIPTNDLHLIVADTSSPEPTSCGFVTKSPPPKLLMDRILQQLEKIDMPRDHGRFKLGPTECQVP